MNDINPIVLTFCLGTIVLLAAWAVAPVIGLLLDDFLGPQHADLVWKDLDSEDFDHASVEETQRGRSLLRRDERTAPPTREESLRASPKQSLYEQVRQFFATSNAKEDALQQAYDRLTDDCRGPKQSTKITKAQLNTIKTEFDRLQQDHARLSGQVDASKQLEHHMRLQLNDTENKAARLRQRATEAEDNKYDSWKLNKDIQIAQHAEAGAKRDLHDKIQQMGEARAMTDQLQDFREKARREERKRYLCEDQLRQAQQELHLAVSTTREYRHEAENWRELQKLAETTVRWAGRKDITHDADLKMLTAERNRAWHVVSMKAKEILKLKEGESLLIRKAERQERESIKRARDTVFESKQETEKVRKLLRECQSRRLGDASSAAAALEVERGGWVAERKDAWQRLVKLEDDMQRCKNASQDGEAALARVKVLEGEAIVMKAKVDGSMWSKNLAEKTYKKERKAACARVKVLQRQLEVLRATGDGWVVSKEMEEKTQKVVEKKVEGVVQKVVEKKAEGVVKGVRDMAPEEGAKTKKERVARAYQKADGKAGSTKKAATEQPVVPTSTFPLEIEAHVTAAAAPVANLPAATTEKNGATKKAAVLQPVVPTSTSPRKPEAHVAFSAAPAVFAPAATAEINGYVVSLANPFAHLEQMPDVAEDGDEDSESMDDVVVSDSSPREQGMEEVMVDYVVGEAMVEGEGDEQEVLMSDYLVEREMALEREHEVLMHDFLAAEERAAEKWQQGEVEAVDPELEDDYLEKMEAMRQREKELVAHGEDDDPELADDYLEAMEAAKKMEEMERAKQLEGGEEEEDPELADDYLEKMEEKMQAREKELQAAGFGKPECKQQ
ncbi:hypothetical protein LTR62_006289 [Meristemomyces frigidus]|uniref:Uncharacterized protein n=1 Tax=Meristemomyces frigidus TaxID=1508187 RepID=A0AAN7TEE5_9PEZI|nr:hypothetical protein LTR62_006289 [Meristemomyces frigidus]